MAHIEKLCILCNITQEEEICRGLILKILQWVAQMDNTTLKKVKENV